MHDTRASRKFGTGARRRPVYELAAGGRCGAASSTCRARWPHVARAGERPAGRRRGTQGRISVRRQTAALQSEAESSLHVPAVPESQRRVISGRRSVFRRGGDSRAARRGLLGGRRPVRRPVTPGAAPPGGDGPQWGTWSRPHCPRATANRCAPRRPTLAHLHRGYVSPHGHTRAEATGPVPAAARARRPLMKIQSHYCAD